MTGCHHAAKVINMEKTIKSSMPIAMQKNRLPQSVKSVLVVQAYAVSPTVMPAVMPAAVITLDPVNLVAN